MKQIRIIVADDSPICRAELRQILEQDRDIKIVGEASDGGGMLELLERFDPDMLVVDLQMPGVDGLTTVERVMASRPLPILVVTSKPEGRRRDVVFEAIRRGALDLAEKPAHADARSQALLRAKVRQLAPIPVIRHVAAGQLLQPVKPAVVAAPPAPVKKSTDAQVFSTAKVVGVAASAGGPAALVNLLKDFPREFPACFAVVQHLPRGFAKAFSEYLQSRIKLTVRVAEEGSKILTGYVYVAPDDRHLVVRSAKHLGAEDSPPVEGHKPAATVLLASLARVLGSSATGIVLSGIGQDGVAGLRELRARGALTLAQDPESSAVYGMPRAAIESGAAQRALDPAGLARAVAGAVGAQAVHGGRP
jgi:two-component system chemotaxis response regulator CheB